MLCQVLITVFMVVYEPSAQKCHLVDDHSDVDLAVLLLLWSLVHEVVGRLGD